jgi:hypothetical protein
MFEDVFFSKEKKRNFITSWCTKLHYVYIHLLVYSVTLETVVECYLFHFVNASAFCYFHKNFVSLDFLEHVLLYVLQLILI